MKSISFAVVGCGAIGQRHIRHIKAHPQAELVATCDVVEARAEGFDVPAYRHLSDLLEKHPTVDVITICTPNNTHAPLSIRALNAGHHVLCEKPMALRSSDCLDMLHAAEKMQKMLFVVKQNRYNPPVVAVKQAIETGRFGNIYQVAVNCYWNRNKAYYQHSSWKGRLEQDGGTLFTQFSHFIDLLYWLIGDVTTVQAIRRNVAHDYIDFEDCGGALLEFKSGAIGTITYTICAHQKNMEGSITIFAEKGTVKIGGQYLNVLEYQNIQDFVIQDVPQSSPANDYGFYHGSMSNHDKVIANVVETILGREQIATTGIEGLKTVEIIEKIYRASR
ncbi:MAG: gfo/Idh/MocA family oxidoreductase [Gemmatimonadetes bacterium]|nr:MAG: gfo/Idh/MocA family oxidoreductase [Gemmatimonadota bacterium]